MADNMKSKGMALEKAKKVFSCKTNNEYAKHCMIQIHTQTHTLSFFSGIIYFIASQGGCLGCFEEVTDLIVANKPRIKPSLCFLIRTLRLFGNRLGNSVYDKEHVNKLKVRILCDIDSCK